MAVYFPEFSEYQSLKANARFVPIYRKVLSDSHSPVSAFMQCQQGDRTFLFESVVGGEQIGRYSFLGADPFLTIESYEDKISIQENGNEKTYSVGDPLDELARLLDQYSSIHHPGLPRFCGGAVGYAGYDIVRCTENLPNAPEDDRNFPDLSFSFYNEMMVFDHINKTILVISHADTQAADAEKEYHEACLRIDTMVARLESPTAPTSVVDIDPVVPPLEGWKSNCTQEQFEAGVNKCKEYIQAGDIFQVVISQRLDVETTATPMDIYRALRVVNPSPFMFLLTTPDGTLIGSSPEIMVRAEDGLATVRPLAGTRKRGKTAAEDQQLAEELLADPKERAEHIMLVDLARNDVGRIADYNSVEISDVMVVERYSHVMHITSNVTGQIREGMTSLDALRAALPAGTVSGSPKVRAMEIIDEVETHRRGPYAGAVGYIDYTGNMDTCIALRTIVMQGNKAYIQAGAGIVADSDPTMEYQETLNKARGILTAINVAESQVAKNV